MFINKHDGPFLYLLFHYALIQFYFVHLSTQLIEFNLYACKAGISGLKRFNFRLLFVYHFLLFLHGFHQWHYKMHV